MSSSCNGLFEELRLCIKESPCMKKDGRKFHDCLNGLAKGDASVESCQGVRAAYSTCKRSQIDRRARIPGNPGR